MGYSLREYLQICVPGEFSYNFLSISLRKHLKISASGEFCEDFLSISSRKHLAVSVQHKGLAGGLVFFDPPVLYLTRVEESASRHIPARAAGESQNLERFRA